MNGNEASDTAYNPVGNQNVSVRVMDGNADSISLDLLTSDYPYLLTIQD